MKHIYQIIGFLAVILILGFALLFWVENYLPAGDFKDFVRSMHIVFEEMKETFSTFFSNTDIANTTADLLTEGAEKIRGAAEPASSAIPAATPSPAPTTIIIDVPLQPR